MLLRNVYAVQPGRVECHQLHLTPDTRIGKAGAPVPAEHTMGLAQIGKTSHGIGAAFQRPFFIGFPYEAGGGMKHHLQLILFSSQQVFYGIFPNPVHVLHMSQQGSIQVYISDRINSVKMKQDFFPLPDILRHIKTGDIGKIIFHDFQRLQFVVPVIRILHFVVVQQILVNASRHGGGHKFLRIVDAHLPVFIQLLYKHPFPPFPRSVPGQTSPYRRFSPPVYRKEISFHVICILPN